MKKLPVDEFTKIADDFHEDMENAENKSIDELVGISETISNRLNGLLNKVKNDPELMKRINESNPDLFNSINNFDKSPK